VPGVLDEGQLGIEQASGQDGLVLRRELEVDAGGMRVNQYDEGDLLERLVPTGASR